jgi:3',5'-cyclic AMP phosphodiesterase CpdA
MRLLAISDLHLAHAANRDALDTVRQYPDDWLVLAGDVGEQPAQLDYALHRLAPKFQRIIWTPGNHDLWTSDPIDTSRGQRRYEDLLAICRRYEVLTPEDAYIKWPPDEHTYIVPMFLLFDYSFRPPTVPLEHAISWARESGVMCADEYRLDPAPWASRAAWCRARCAHTEIRLRQLPDDATTILINHWPLRYDLARPPRIPRFSIWCGTTITEDWALRFHARSVVSGHLHMRTTLWRDSVRYEEVSLGYPRDWDETRGINWYLREILPSDPQAQSFVPSRDPFLTNVSR